MVDLVSCFLEGQKQAEAEIEMLTDAKRRAELFLARFVNLFKPSINLPQGYSFDQQGLKLTLCRRSKAGGSEEVAWVIVDFPCSSMAFGDPLLESGYPLPLSEASFEVLAKYFGVSLAWSESDRTLANDCGNLRMRMSVKDQIQDFLE